MGRELQKRKRRSSRPKVQTHNRPKKALNPCGNDVVAKNWDKKLTLTQNYRRLGLVAHLKPPTGGMEKALHAGAGAGFSGAYTTQQPQPFAIAPTEQRILSETRVERDADGNIVRVIKSRRRNPLNDPLVDFDLEEEEEAGGAGRGQEEEEEEEWDGIQGGDDDVVRELERQANKPVARQRRLASAREVEWLGKLVEKHRDDTRGMARDMRLNPMQQTAGELAKRLRAAYGNDWVDKIQT